MGNLTGRFVQIEKRDNLETTSEICINELCTLDLSRINFDTLLTKLTVEEQREVNLKLSQHLGLI